MKQRTLLGGKYPPLRPLAFTLAGFVLILFGLNLYQYFRIKTDIGSTLIQKINDRKLRELRSIFDNLNEKLFIVREWGKNGVLEENDLISLNKKFFPLINHQQNISAVLLAKNTGWEYFLMQKGTSWSTRTTQPLTDTNRVIYMNWKKPEEGEVIDEKTTDYDPRNRPWFHRSLNQDEVYWTGLYTFHETGRKGLTASVSWDDTNETGNFLVFGMDISLGEIQNMLVMDGDNETGKMFLVNPTVNLIVSASGTGKDHSTADSDDLIPLLVRQWKKRGTPDREAIRIRYGGHSWLCIFQPLARENGVFWIGVTAEEKELLHQLNTNLLQPDLADILVVLAGGLVLVFLFWKNAGLHRYQTEVDPLTRLNKLIAEGEGTKVEFKSTVRTNLVTGKKGKEIEFAWLKTIVAFLNTDGGALLLGVDDNGQVIGLSTDNFENNDRCLLHIKNLINQYIGAEFSGFIHVSIQRIVSGKDVVLIDVRRARQPVFLKVGKNEEFYIRSGPSSSKLTPSQMVSYITQHRTERKKTDS